MTADVGSIFQVAGKASERRPLQRAFTTVHDVGGPSFGVKRAIDELSWRHENDASICKKLTVRSPHSPRVALDQHRALLSKLSVILPLMKTFRAFSDFLKHHFKLFQLI